MITLGEVSQKEKEIPYDITYVWNLKYGANEPIYKTGGNGNPPQYSCLENSTDGGAWWATVHGVAKSRKRLSDFTSLSLGWS